MVLAGRPRTPRKERELRPSTAEARRGFPHLPALDGLRGVAVALVLLFHSGLGWAPGGYFGVTVFFVLSGFLIGGLLLVERDRDGGIDLHRFWARRARRLVPAVVVLFALVAAYVHVAVARRSPSLLGDAVASLGWVANWRFVLAHRSYGDLFGTPSPFQHMWSLGVEEQFYLGLTLLAVIVLLRGRTDRIRLRCAAVLVLGIGLSTLIAAMTHQPGGPTERAYYGTDARIAEPLLGVLLAVALVGAHGPRRLTNRWRRLLGVTGMICAAGLGFLVATLGSADDALYRGGFLLAAALAAGVIAASTQPGTLASRALSAAPLVALGRISYGVYLFHWPVFLWLTPARTGFSNVQLLSVRLGATVALASVSYVLIEKPVRVGRVRALPALASGATASAVLLALLSVVPPLPAPAARFAAGSAIPPPPPPPLAGAAGSTLASGGHLPAAPAAARHRRSVRASSKPLAESPKSKGSVKLEGEGGARRPSPPPKVSHTLRVAVVGDSLAGDLGRGLSAWADERGDVVVYDLTTPGCPLSRGGTRRLSDGTDWPVRSMCAWWADPESTRSRYLSQFAPDVVVMEDGLNELPDRKLPDWLLYRYPGERSFDLWLIDEYRTAIAAFSANGAPVLALNTPCADWEALGGSWTGYATGEGDRRVSALGSDNEELASAGVRSVDLRAHLCPDGRFSNSVDGVEDARSDGYHLSDDAAKAVARTWLGPLVEQTASGESSA